MSADSRHIRLTLSTIHHLLSMPGFLEEHHAIVQELVRGHYGPLHARVVQALCGHGPMTLHELAGAVRQSHFSRTGSTGAADDDDAAIKSAVARLHEHEVVLFNETSKVYDLRLGRGLARVVFPVLLQHVQQMYGDTGVAVVMLFVEYGALPSSTLLQLLTQRHPHLHSALQLAIEQMRSDGLLVSPDTTEQDLLALREPSSKKSRRESAATATSSLVSLSYSALTVLTLNVPLLIHKVRMDAIIAFMSTRSDDAGPKIVRAIVQCDTAVPKWQKDRDNGFPSCVEVSSTVALLTIRELLPDVRDDAFLAAVSRLTSADGGMVLSRADGGDGGGLRLHYGRIVDLMRLDCCEQVIFSRFGVLGVRLMKALVRNDAMEERFLAEEVIATLPQVRETTAGMMRDGYLRQIEIPKVINTERQPKNSIFLWNAPRDALTSTVARQLVKALRHATLRISVEHERMSAGMPQQAKTSDQTHIALSPAEERARRVGEHALQSLRAASFALMHQVLLMNFF